VVGLNIPQPVVHFVARFGLAALPAAARARLPRVDTSNENHRRRFFSLLGAPDPRAAGPAVGAAGPGGHGGLARLELLYESQALWDEYMAQSAADRLLRRPGERMLIICGAGHAVGRASIPDRVQRRMQQVS
jgi:hypothetical protein